MADFAKQGGHWYVKGTGEPFYTMTGAKGQERAVTLRDAKKLGTIVPSVTTILRLVDKPGLTQWFIKNAIMSARTLPSIPGESDEDYEKRIILDSQEKQNTAMQLGTDIHAAIENAYLGKDVPQEYQAHVDATRSAVQAVFNTPVWSAERSFATDRFGGKLDLSADGIVIDFKTKEFGPTDKVQAWDEQIWQLAAYRQGLNMPTARCANVYISTSVPGLVKVIEHKEEDLAQGWKCFQCLLDFYYAKTGLGA
jgi:hypothetical protein